MLEFLQSNIPWIASALSLITALLIAPILKIWRRVERMDAKIETLPTGDQLSEIKTQPERTQGEVKTVKAAIQRMDHQLNLILESHLQRQPMKQLLIEDQRLVILRSLLDMPGYTTNESILQSCLSTYGHHVSRDQVRGALSWLEGQGLIDLEDIGGILVAKILRLGQDVAEGRGSCPGVKKPRAKASL